MPHSVIAEYSSSIAAAFPADDAVRPVRGVARLYFEVVASKKRAAPSGEDAHDGLAAGGQIRRVPHSFRAGLRAFGKTVRLAAALAGLLLACLLPAQDNVSFRSGVALARVDAEVTDANGGILTGLGKDDFRVSDDGAEQTVVSFNFEEDPLDLILLFDLAGSMRGKVLRVVRAVELGFHELKSGDRVSVMTYGPGATEVLPFTTNLDAVNQAIVLKVVNEHFGGNSGPEMAAAELAKRFRREAKSRRRRAVLVISDKPGAAGMEGTAAAAVRELWLADAVLGELVIGRGEEVRVQGTSAMAEKTGGPTVLAGDPGAAFQRAVRLLRRRYALYYAPPGTRPGAEHQVDVRLSAAALRRFPGARVRARTGYIAP